MKKPILEIGSFAKRIPDAIRLSAKATLLIGLLAASTLESAEPEPRWELFLKNGDRVRGDFLGIEASRINWKYPGVQEIIRFPMENAAEIRQTLMPNKKNKGHDSMVCMTNGDSFAGRIVSMDEKKLALDTMSSGHLSLNKSMISEISRTKAGTMLYSGPNPGDGWLSADLHSDVKKNFEIKDGTLILPPMTFAMCDVSLPDTAQISLEITGFNPNTRLQFQFFTNTGSEGYFLTMQGQYCELEKFTGDEGLNSLDSFKLEDLSEGTLNLILFVSKKNMQIIVSVNNKIYSEIKDHASEFAGTGTSLAFMNMARGIPAEVRKIRVSPWDGRDPRQVLDAVAIEGKDQIFLSNMDRSSGELLGLTRGSFRVKSDFGTFDIPIERVRRIVRDKSKQRTAKRNRADIRVFLEGNTVATLKLEGFSNRKLSGISDNFGRAEFRTESIKRLVFGIYEPHSNDPGKSSAKDKDAWQKILDPAAGIDIDLNHLPALPEPEEE